MIPEIDQYSPEEIVIARSSWPAIDLYLNLISRVSNGPGDTLRIKRHQAWIRCALATFFRKSSPNDICLYWSKIAESLILEAWKQVGGDQLEICILAMGKLGSEELNLSSDVDLIFIREDFRDQTAPELENETRILRAFQNLLTEYTEFGFALRVDLNLRPGGKSSPLLQTFSQMEYHYGYLGEMWERLAFVRMRILAGPADLSKKIEKFTTRYSYRKHLDYTVLDELKSLRTQIQRETKITSDSFHLKLGYGAIRDVELYVQSLQIIHGGRILDLRTQSTSNAISKLSVHALLPNAESVKLSSHYWYLREIENSIQSINDQQSYVVDEKLLQEKIPWFDFQELIESCREVGRHVDSLLPTPQESAELFSNNFDLQSEWLTQLGFNSKSVNEIWPELLKLNALAKHSAPAERERMIFLNHAVRALAETKIDQNLGLELLRDFVRSTRAKSTFFSLLNREPRLIEDLCLLFSVSPYLGGILASRPELIDAYVLQRQDLAIDAPIEDFLDSLIEHRLLAETLSGVKFLWNCDVNKLTKALTTTADKIFETLKLRVCSEQQAPPLGVVALGKWGGREIGLKSDLDFVFISENPLDANTQKISKRMISRLTESHRGGSIYPIDLRLRPSGNSGPMVVSSKQLNEFLLNHAPAWQRQAYTRARCIGVEINQLAELIVTKALTTSDFQELRSIHKQLFLTNNTRTIDSVDLKFCLGGLSHIEFTAQISLLADQLPPKGPSTIEMIDQLMESSPLWRDLGLELKTNFIELRYLEQLFQLTTNSTGSRIHRNSENLLRTQTLIQKLDHQKRISIAMFTKTPDLFQNVADKVMRNQVILDLLDPLKK